MFLRSTTPWWLPGAALILFGLAIIVFPELVALLVASVFIMAGAGWLALASGARKARREQQTPVYVVRERRDWGWF